MQSRYARLRNSESLDRSDGLIRSRFEPGKEVRVNGMIGHRTPPDEARAISQKGEPTGAAAVHVANGDCRLARDLGREPRRLPTPRRGSDR